jgi:hypothetical protein
MQRTRKRRDWGFVLLDPHARLHYGIEPMMKKVLGTVTLAAAVAAGTVVGCGGSSSTNNGGNNNNGGDSGTGATGSDSGGPVVSPGKDGGGASDAGNGGNPPLPDGSVLPHGNQLVPGTTLTLDGVTSDDFVIYTDTSNSTVYALSLASGSKPISLGNVDMNNDVFVSGKVVVIGTSVTMNGTGAASVWTSTASAPAMLSTSTLQGTLAVGADGHVLFLDGVDGAGSAGAIAIAAADGTGKTTLVPSVDLSSNVCFPQLAVAGTTSTYAVAAYCETSDAGTIDAGGAIDASASDAAASDAGPNVNIGTVSTFAAPGWTKATIGTNVQTVFSVDQGATKIVVAGTTGTVAYPIAGGAPVPIDATGALGTATFSPGILTKDGSHLLYTTTTQALERAATTSPATPTQLAGAGKFADLFGLSPDESWVIGSLTVNPNNGRGDLYLASASAPGTPVTLSSATTNAVSGDPFTADSTHVLYMSAISKGVGTLNAAPVSAAGTPTALGTAVAGERTTTGAKVIFNDGYNQMTGGADLRAVDTSASAAATLLVTQADPGFFLNAEKTTIIYTWSYQAGSSAGLWTLAAP